MLSSTMYIILHHHAQATTKLNLDYNVSSPGQLLCLRCRRGSLDCVIYVVFTINFGGLCFSISSIGLFASKLSDTYPNLDIKMLLYFLFAIYVYCVRVVFLYDYELSVAIWN